jgi:hypothetical protein
MKWYEGESLNSCTADKFRVDKSTEAYKQIIQRRIVEDTNNTSCANRCVCDVSGLTI